MIKSYALPRRVSPYFDFHISEELLKRSVNPRLVRIIRDGQLSLDLSARAALIEGSQLCFLINEGGNGYETSIAAVSHHLNNFSDIEVTIPAASDTSRTIGVVIPEKQTVISSSGLLDGKYSLTYGRAISILKSKNLFPVLEFNDLFAEEHLLGNIASMYDSHLTNHASLLIFASILKNFDIKCSLEKIRWRERVFYPDLLSKFVSCEFRVPWLDDGPLVYEQLAEPGRNRGLVRKFKNDDAAIKGSILFVGDSHSYSGLVPIASQLFSHSLFVWASPFDFLGHHAEIESFKPDFTVYEVSERFLYNQMLRSLS